MSRPSEVMFVHLIRRLDEESFAAFVVDLWNARGWETEMRNGVVVTTNPKTGAHHTLYPLHHGGMLSRFRRRKPPVADIDVIVAVDYGFRERTLAAELDADIVDASTLYEILIYAIDEDCRTRLLKDYFDRSTLFDGAIGSVLNPRHDIVGWYRVNVPRVRATFSSCHSRPLIGLTLVTMALLAWILVSQSPLLAFDSETDQIEAVGHSVDQTPVSTQPIGRSNPSGSQSIGFLIVNSTKSEPLWPVGVVPGGDWPTFGFDVARTGYAPDAVGPRGTIVRTANRSLDIPVIGSPVVVNGIVYVPRYDGMMFALDARSLSVEWRLALDQPIVSTPAVANGIVYVGTAGGTKSDSQSSIRSGDTLYAVSADTGRVRWRAAVGPIVHSPPAVVDGAVYVANHTGGVQAIDADTGIDRWNTSTDGTVRSSIAFADETVYIGEFGGIMMAFAAENGTIRWNRSVQGQIFSSPTVSNGTVYLGTGTGHVYAFDAATGADRWTRSIDGTIRVSPAVANGTIYVVNGTGGVHAFDAATGDDQWIHSVRGSSSAAPVIANGTVYVGTQIGNVYSGVSEGRLYALNTESGTVSWVFIANGGISSSPVIAGDTVYVADYFGWVYRLTGCRSSEPSGRTYIVNRIHCR
ncbi:MAG: PQQ-binding-like beta-propeller repeat protein [Halobacteriales archaeon]